MYFNSINIIWQLVYYSAVLLSITGLLPKAITAFVVSTLFFTIPIGVGLWLIPRNNTKQQGKLPKTITFPLMFLVGLVVITGLFVAKERITIFSGSNDYLFYTIIVIAIGGWITRSQVLQFDQGSKNFGRMLLIVFPVYIILYAIKYFYYSEFPVTDLFQMTHFMKGAEELSRYDILNPFTANSYIPVLQVMFGIMRKYLSYEILEGIWYLPLSYFILQTAVYYSFAQQLLKSERKIIVLVIGLTIYTGVNVISNSGLVELISMTLLSVLLVVKNNCSKKISTLLCVIVFSMIVVASIIVKLDPVVIIIVICLFAVLFRVNQGFKNGPIALIAVLLPIVLIPIHREAIMVIPVIVGMIMWFSILETNTSLRKVLVYVVPVSIVFILAYIFLRRYMAIKPDPILDIITYIIKLLLGTDITTNLESRSGMGGWIAIFELSRKVGLLLSVLVIISLSTFIHDRSIKHANGLKLDSLTLLLFAGSIILIILVGIPFAHRIGFILVAILLSMIVSIEYRMQYGIKLLGILLVLLSSYIVLFSLKDTLFIEKYAILFWGFLIIAISILIFAYISSEHRQALTLVSVFFIMILDRGVTRAYFQEYAYNNSMTDSSSIISHYSIEDLKVASYLKKKNGRFIIFSDPHTMAIISALTGYNKILTYSNIDSMPDNKLDRLKLSLFNLVSNKQSLNGKSNECHANSVLKNYLFTSPLGAELNYFIQRVSLKNWTGYSVLNEFDMRGGFIVSSKIVKILVKNDFADNEIKLNFINKKLGVKNSGLRYLSKFQNSDLSMVLIVSPKTRNWIVDKNMSRPNYFKVRENTLTTLTDNLLISCGAVKLKNTSVLIVSVKSLIRFVLKDRSMVNVIGP